VNPVAVDPQVHEDLGSTNGSSVVDIAGTSICLSPGVRVAVTAGSEIHFGDRTVLVAASQIAPSD